MKYTKEEQAANRAKWVEALRSGKYKQHQGRLRTRPGDSADFCCLGVACDISGLGTWDEEGMFQQEGTAVKFTGVLPTSVKEWLGLFTAGGSVLGTETALTTMNDSGSSFEEIAQLIEDEPRLLAN